MNAIKLYVSAARLILENENYNQSICTEINNTLPHLEQSLTCIVCRNILREPYSPTDTTCQHHVCKTCVGGRKRLKPSCSWCKDYTKYTKNTQLQCLIACYKALCNYVKHSNLLHQLNTVSLSTDGNRNILSVVQKGAELSLHNREFKIKAESCDEDEQVNDVRYRHHTRRDSSNSPHNHVLENASSESSNTNDVPRIRVRQDLSRISPSGTDKLANSDNTKVSSIHNSSRLRSGSDHTNIPTNLDKLSDSTSEELNPKTVYSVSFTGTRSKIILKRKHVNSRKDLKKKESNHLENRLQALHTIRTSSSQLQNNCSLNEGLRFRRIKAKSVANSDRPSCRCGNATAKPGKLTCCGQRCACYMQSKACTGCRCRGCRNPHMIDGVKVLGRFTKDDSPEPTLITSDVTSFPDLSAHFLNEQMNQVLPSSNTSVLNTS